MPTAGLKPQIEQELLTAWLKLGGKREQFPAPDRLPRRLHDRFHELGAGSDLLTTVGSYGDTMPDDWVLAELRRWNGKAG